MKLKVVSTLGQNTTLEVSDAVFGDVVNLKLVAQAVRVYLSNQRQGSSKVKTRSEINRTKKKWFKQKGTGNARHGARTPNIFVGGGVAHGPTGEQNWDLKMPSAMRRKALVSALSAQVEHLIVSDDLHQLDGKTASAQKMLEKMLPGSDRILVVMATAEPLVLRSMRNLPSVYVTHAQRLTAFEVAAADGIVVTKDAIKILETRLSPVKKEVEKEELIEVEPKAEPNVKAEPKTVKKPATKKVVKK